MQGRQGDQEFQEDLPKRDAFVPEKEFNLGEERDKISYDNRWLREVKSFSFGETQFGAPALGQRVVADAGKGFFDIVDGVGVG